ncbi:MAG: efflux RND transporter periplasmic adaptor subunit [Gemmataceae bacterium]|nr:efflux RND transporter periplasmic adaptor subunit [Gemmataceae bacterium]
MRRASAFILPVIAFGLLTFAFFHVVRSEKAESALAPPSTPPRTGYGKTIGGVGIVEPQSENIAIGAALPGVVLEVQVKIGQRVAKGAALFRVDDRHLRAQLNVQQANLAAAQAQLAKLEAMPRPEELPPSAAKVRAAKADLELQKDQFLRGEQLIAGQTIASEEFQQRRFAMEKATHQHAQAEAEDKLLRSGAWTLDKSVAKAAVEQMQAQVDHTKTEIERAQVRALVDGTILQVNVRPGEYVATPAPQPLIILGNVEPLHVRVDIDEHDIPRLHPDAPAYAAVRGNPNVHLPLRLVRVEPYVIPKKALTGDNTERVDTRVLQVIYALQESSPMRQQGPAAGQVFVGQLVDVFVEGAQAAVNGTLAAKKN